MRNARHRIASGLMAACLLFGLFPARSLRAAPADSWAGRDKALHFTGTFVLSASGYALGTGLIRSRDAGAILGASVGLGSGALKELVDLAGAGQPSARDFAWSAAGTAVGLLFGFLIDLAVNGWSRPAARR
ncbi:MAG TPA: hypothetical protein PLQ97_02455 [Myxococcota bacterium]|nr:hypothetical protein [Myxococcota bacterium]HQK50691.1 hypothetical protein [Myxococcota bacterium]